MGPLSFYIRIFPRLTKVNKTEIKVIKRDATKVLAKPKGSVKEARRKGAIEVNNWIVERRENNRLESVVLAAQLYAWHTSAK